MCGRARFGDCFCSTGPSCLYRDFPSRFTTPPSVVTGRGMGTGHGTATADNAGRQPGARRAHRNHLTHIWPQVVTSILPASYNIKDFNFFLYYLTIRLIKHRIIIYFICD